MKKSFITLLIILGYLLGGNDNLIALKAFAEIHQHQEHGHDHEDYDHDHEGHDHDHTLATHLVLSMYYIPSPQRLSKNYQIAKIQTNGDW